MQVAWLEDQQPLLSVFVADGAGSVSQGGEGAMLAVNEAMAYISQKVQGGELGLNDVLATDIVLTIRQRFFAEAEAKELAVRDFACTFLGLISSPNGTLIMQIGDGGVVVDLGHGLQLPLTPMVGCKGTSRPLRHGIRHQAVNGTEPVYMQVYLGNGSQQSLGVGMQGMLIDIQDSTALHYLPRVYNGHLLTHLGNHP